MLVLLSLLVAIQASYVGLRLALRVPLAVGIGRKLRVAGSALSLGVGIWSMHFIGMLAAKLPVSINYLVLPTLISFLVCVLVVGAAIVAASVLPPTPMVTAVAAGGMGGGIATMHYIGMYALHASAHMSHDPAFVAASVLIAIVTSGLALWLAFGTARRPPLFVCALVLGIAISGMHYAAMAGMTFHLTDMTPQRHMTAFRPDLLAVIVAVVAFIISGLFLLTLVPERIAAAVPNTPETAAAARDFEAVPAPAPAPSKSASPRALPVERDGQRQLVPQDQVFAVHANAHYTYVFNGREKLFCSLSIGQAEECLDPVRFLRVHRSHIVNLDHVSSVRKDGDNGSAQLASPLPTTVPVSRSKLTDLRARMSAQSMQAAD